MSHEDFLFGQRVIEPIGEGRYRLSLSPEERAVLRDVSKELGDQIEAGGGDRSMFRLFPPGYSEDLLRQVEYDRLMHDELQTSHLASLQVISETSEMDELDEVTLMSWMRALNQIRLVLGTRLDITEEVNEDELADEGPEAPAYALYSYLGYLQSHAVDALAESVDPDGVPGADDFGPEG